MLPTSSSSRPSSEPNRRSDASKDEPRESVDAGHAEEQVTGKQKGAPPLGPIGPERLAALREAIQNGTYPTESDTLGGLTRLLLEP